MPEPAELDEPPTTAARDEGGAVPRSPHAAGFTYIETLVSLTILTLALLLGVDVFLQTVRANRRMENERQAFRALESTLEAVRSGSIPLASGWFDNLATAVGNPAPPDMRILMQVDETAPGSHLYSVHLRGTYHLEGKQLTKDLYSMIFRPDPSP